MPPLLIVNALINKGLTKLRLIPATVEVSEDAKEALLIYPRVPRLETVEIN